MSSTTTTTTTTTPTTILLQGGRVVNADEEFLADVLIQNDKIVQIILPSKDKLPTTTTAATVDDGSSSIGIDHVRIIDCTGKLIIPGGIDPHTHCELPFMGQVAVDDFEYGTKAAVAGGTTMLIDFAIPQAGENLLDVYRTWYVELLVVVSRLLFVVVQFGRLQFMVEVLTARRSKTCAAWGLSY